MKCIECQHWLPRKAPQGLASLGFAPCSLRSMTMGHTFSALSGCDRYSQAEADTINRRTAYLNRANINTGGEQVMSE